MANFIIPPGKATGLLPRESRVGEWIELPRASDRIEVIPEDEVMDRIRELEATGRTLDKLIRHYFDQNGVKSCAAEAATGALELKREVEGQPFELLNPWTLYRYLTRRDDGSSLDSNLRRMTSHGILPDRVWPRYDTHGDVVHRWTEYPPESLFETDGCRYRAHEHLDVERWEELRTLLLGRKPGLFGHRQFGPDGHAEIAVKLIDKDRFLKRNSWGSTQSLKVFHRRDIEWKYGAFSPVSAVDAGDV